MSIRGRIRDNIWERRPELIPVLTKEHQTYKGLFFEIGRDPETGKYDIRQVIYPKGWAIEQVKAAVENRERILQTEGCSHCTVLNKSHSHSLTSSPPRNSTTGTNNGNGAEHERRFRVLPGKRPVRDWFLRSFWDPAD